MISRSGDDVYGWDADGIEVARLTQTYSTYHGRLDRLERIGRLPERFLRLLDRLAGWWAIVLAYRAKRRTAIYDRFYGITPERQAALAERGRQQRG